MRGKENFFKKKLFLPPHPYPFKKIHKEKTQRSGIGRPTVKQGAQCRSFDL